MPVPQPMSRQRWRLPSRSSNRWRQARKLPCVGTNTPSSTAISGSGSGNRSRPLRSRQRGGSIVSAGASSPAPLASTRPLEPAVARLGVREALARGADQLGPDAAAAADDLRALLAPLKRHLRVRLAGDLVVEAPAVAREVAEVRVDAERHVGEVTQPGDHPGHVVGRDAVDQQGAHAHLLEAARRAAEQVALRPAPVLAVDAAHAVPAAPEAEPDRQPGLEQRLDGHVDRRARRARASPRGSGRAAPPRAGGPAAGSSPGPRGCRPRR